MWSGSKRKFLQFTKFLKFDSFTYNVHLAMLFNYFPAMGSIWSKCYCKVVYLDPFMENYKFHYQFLLLYLMIIHTSSYSIYNNYFRYKIMKDCWNFEPEDRPSFTTLVKVISQQVQLTKQKKSSLLQSDPNSPYLKVF